MTQYLDYTSCTVPPSEERRGSTMLCQYLAVFGWIDEDDEGAICPGQKLKGGRAGGRGREGRDGADRSIQFNMRGEEDRERETTGGG